MTTLKLFQNQRKKLINFQLPSLKFPTFGASVTCLMVSFLLLFNTAYAQVTPCTNCSANDINVISVELVKLNPNYTPINGQPQYLSLPATCSGSEVITGVLKITVDQNASTRYGIRVFGDLLVDGQFSSVFQYCDNAEFVSGAYSNIYLETAPINWVCGTKLEVRNLFVGWGINKNGNACNASNNDCNLGPHCRQFVFPTEPPIVVVTPLSADFIATGTCPTGKSVQTYSFDALSVPGGTTGGTVPYPANAYSWTIVNASNIQVATMTGANASYDFSVLGTGTYSVTLTVTDDAPVAVSSKSKNITVISCCIKPAEPTLECYQTATFNTTTCSWDVTGDQPVKPTLACYQSATFNTTSCSWDVTGDQPVKPTLACYQSATFNTTTCLWDVTGDQPVKPTLACYQSATFNTTTCLWDVTGTLFTASASPTKVNCFATSDGTATLTFAGGTGPYTVTFNGVTYSNQTSPKTITSLTAKPYSWTVSDSKTCTTSGTVTVEKNVCDALYTYTQGYYGSTGTSCTPVGGLKGGLALIQYALNNITAGSMGTNLAKQLYLGKPGASFTLNYVDASKLPPIMPGGGTAGKLIANYNMAATATYPPLKSGKINNVLLSQTIVLGLNINIQGENLSNFILRPDFLTTMSAAGTACPRVIATCTNGGNVSSMKITANTALMNLLNGKTVADLFKMASAALGGTLPAAGIGYADINGAVDVINRSFDGGRFFLGYYGGAKAQSCSTLALATTSPEQYSSIYKTLFVKAAPVQNIQPVKVTELTVSAYPNPFTDKVRFSIVSPVSGKASLDVYNMMGQKIRTIYQGYLFAGKGQLVEYRISSSYQGNLIYTLRVGDQQVNGKLMQVR